MDSLSFPALEPKFVQSCMGKVLKAHHSSTCMGQYDNDTNIQYKAATDTQCTLQCHWPERNTNKSTTPMEMQNIVDCCDALEDGLQPQLYS